MSQGRIVTTDGSLGGRNSTLSVQGWIDLQSIGAMRVAVFTLLCMHISSQQSKPTVYSTVYLPIFKSDLARRKR
jgi:hypothetical protein